MISGKLEPEAAFINAAVVGALLPLRIAAHKALTVPTAPPEKPSIFV